MKNDKKEEYSNKVIELVKSFDETLTDKDRRKILSYAYKKFNIAMNKSSDKKKAKVKK